MSAAPVPAAPKPSPERVADPRFDRTPKERTALILIVGDDSIRITETVDGGIVTVCTRSLDRDIRLNVRELRALAAMANKVAMFVAKRPEWRP
jgi:hypothetical protein